MVKHLNVFVKPVVLGYMYGAGVWGIENMT